MAIVSAVKAASVAAPSASESSPTEIERKGVAVERLRHRQIEPGVGEQRREHIRHRTVPLAASAPPASIATPRPPRTKSSMSALPGPVSPASERPIRADPGDVGDAADIDDRDRCREAGAPRQRLVIDRHEGRPLTAGGNVGGAEIMNHRQPQPPRQGRAIADLDGQPPLRSMEHGLAVKADDIGPDVRILDEQPLHRVAMGIGDDPLGRGERPRPRRPVGERLAPRPAPRAAPPVRRRYRAETGAVRTRRWRCRR